MILSQSFGCFLAVSATFLSAAFCAAADNGNAKIGEDGRDECSLALIPHTGPGEIDARISRLQTRIATIGKHPFLLERLGWLFVSKGRLSGDAGFYNLAETTARCLIAEQPEDARGRLLRGHALHNLHRFAEAEEVARHLVDEDASNPAAWGLLGDTFIDQGNIEQATLAYKRMIDLRPNLQSLSRAAHLQWLTGDSAGALAIMTKAVRAGSPRESDATAWAHVRLAEYAIQEEEWDLAGNSLDIALSLQENYSFAHLVQARLALARGDWETGADAAARAARATPLPEYQWVLVEALAAAGREEESEVTELALKRSGAANDPRTYALYLISRESSEAEKEIALDLARQELNNRPDVFSHDALAWALHANGESEEARKHIDKALREGTRHSRLFYHAGIIYAACGDAETAAQWLQEAADLKQMLFPDEEEKLFAAHRRIQNSAEK